MSSCMPLSYRSRSTADAPHCQPCITQHPGLIKSNKTFRPGQGVCDMSRVRRARVDLVPDVGSLKTGLCLMEVGRNESWWWTLYRDVVFCPPASISVSTVCILMSIYMLPTAPVVYNKQKIMHLLKLQPLLCLCHPHHTQIRTFLCNMTVCGHCTEDERLILSDLLLP